MRVTPTTGRSRSTHVRQAVGSYSFKAHHVGDSHFPAADSTCESLAVIKADLSVATVVHDPAHATVDNGSPAPLGTQVHDKATVTGGVGGFAVPGVTFTFYTSNDCTTGDSALVTDGAVSGGTRSIDTSVLDAGDYSFQASVPDDDTYNGDTSDCELSGGNIAVPDKPRK